MTNKKKTNQKFKNAEEQTEAFEYYLETEMNYPEYLEKICEKTENDIATAMIEFMKLKDYNTILVRKNKNKFPNSPDYKIKDLISKMGEILAILKTHALYDTGIL